MDEIYLTRSYRRQSYIKCDSCGTLPERSPYEDEYLSCGCAITAVAEWNAYTALRNLDRALMIGSALSQLALFRM